MCTSVIRLASGARTTISREAPRSADLTETGGILLGHDRGDHFLVTTAGGPGPHPVREARRFLRDLAYSKALADRAYRRDGSVWIGEWHTHPEGHPEPSDLDLTTYARHIEDPRLGFARFLTVIAVPCTVHGWLEVNLIPWIIDGPTAVMAAFDCREEDRYA